MIAVIVICFLALTVTALSFYVWGRPQSGANPDREIAPPRFAGLFPIGKPPAAQSETKKTETRRLRTDLIESARAGDLSTLSEAHATEDAALYCKVLDALIDSASGSPDNPGRPVSEERFRALVSHISKSDKLRGNKQLAERVMAAWEATEVTPDRRSTITMMHIAALSDDAVVYQHAMELVIALWQKGKLVEFSPEEMIELFDSQFWVLAPEARRGGAGFALKRRLAGVRRELATTTHARP